MSDLVAALAAAGVAEVAGDETAASLTTLRVGGGLAALVTVADVGELKAVGDVARSQHADVLVVGRGSNLLLADEGFDGIVVRLGRSFRHVDVNGTTLTAGGAAPMPTVAKQAAEAGLAGLAWMAAVPGTIGGGVRMNAGAHGSDVAASLVETRIHDLHSGETTVRRVDELELAYRHSNVARHDVVLDAIFHLAAGSADQVRAEMDEIRAWRREHQPLNEPNCGSVFTNPPGDSAGRLIEAAGCKGLTIGGASVSQRHANFIVTRPEATAADVAALIGEVIEEVQRVHGITLSTEVVAVGKVDW